MEWTWSGVEWIPRIPRWVPRIARRVFAMSEGDASSLLAAVQDLIDDVAEAQPADDDGGSDEFDTSVLDEPEEAAVHQPAAIQICVGRTQGLVKINVQKPWSEVARIAPPEGLRQVTYESTVSVNEVHAFRRRQVADAEEYDQVFVVAGDGAVAVVNQDGSDVDDEEHGILKGFMPMQRFLAAWHDGLLTHAGGPAPCSIELPSAAVAPDMDPDVVAPLGGRAALAYEDGGNFNWYGCTVAAVHADGARVLACDDGEVVVMPIAELRAVMAAKGIKPLNAAEGGMKANKTGYPVAADVVWYKEGRMSDAAAVGVLLGDEQHVLGGGVSVYQACVLNPEAYNQDGELIGAEPRSSRGARQRGGKCLNTYRRGNKVEMQVEDTTYYAHVFGVGFSGKDTSPRLKYMLLRDASTRVFFVARFGVFSRTLLQADADVNDDEQVVTMADDEVQTMVDEYKRLKPFSSLTTPAKLRYAAGTWIHCPDSCLCLYSHVSVTLVLCNACFATLRLQLCFDHPPPPPCATEKTASAGPPAAHQAAEEARKAALAAAGVEKKASRKNLRREGKRGKGPAALAPAAASLDGPPAPLPPAPKETTAQKRAREAKERKEQAEADAQREELEREASEGRDTNAALQRKLTQMRKELAIAKLARAEPPPPAQMPGADAVAHTHSGAPPQPAAPRLPPGWSAHVDGRSGATFYFKRETREKTWTHPDVESEPSPPPVEQIAHPLRRSTRISPNAEHSISRMLNEPPVQPPPLPHATSSAGPSHVGPWPAGAQASGSWAAARLAQLDAQLRGQQAADQARAAESRIELRRQQAEYESFLRFPPHSMQY